MLKKPDYIISGNPITKKNSQQIFRGKNGKPYITQSKQYKAFERHALEELKDQDRKDIPEPVNVRCLYYMQTRRRVDLTNLLEATMDILQRTEPQILTDDSNLIVGGHDGSRVLYDKENPRTEIYITPLKL